jgi:excisionase family DNA binding protein
MESYSAAQKDSTSTTLLTVPQAARDLTISVRTLWRLIAARDIESIRIGRSVRLTRASIAAFVGRGGSR